MSTNAKVTLWDNSTQGLDSTTSFRFGNSLQSYTKSGRNIAIAALYQASDDLANLFDKVTLLQDGHQIFFGTIQETDEYLSSLGFIWPERQSMCEFFVSVTDPNLKVTKEGWEDKVPRSVEDFVKCWKDSSYYQKLQSELEKQIVACTGDKTVKSTSQLPAPKASRRESSYTLTWRAQL